MIDYEDRMFILISVKSDLQNQLSLFNYSIEKGYATSLDPSLNLKKSLSSPCRSRGHRILMKPIKSLNSRMRRKHLIPQRNHLLSCFELQICDHSILWCNHPNRPKMNSWFINYFNYTNKKRKQSIFFVNSQHRILIIHLKVKTGEHHSCLKYDSCEQLNLL